MLNRDRLLNLLVGIHEVCTREQFIMERDGEIFDLDGNFVGHLEMDKGSAYVVLEGDIIADGAERDSES